ncbi:hypothetical protein AO368_1008 [Moraxella catarrhalis]|nr:hypothetical protein AO368_1008 [Moraxella catarrhalis]
MSYNLNFTESAKKKEYDKLDSNIRDQFKKKLKQILENPKIPKNRLRVEFEIFSLILPQNSFIMQLNLCAM